MNSFFFFKALYQFPNDLASKQFASKAEDTRDAGLIPGWGRYPGESIPVFLPEKPHGQKKLVGYSPKGHKELDTTE